MPNGFTERFKGLLGDLTNEEFAKKSETSTAAVAKARAGLDIATKHLEVWAKAFGLTGKDAEDFVSQGLEAEAMSDKKRGHLYRKMRDNLAETQAELARTRGLLRELMSLLEQPPNRLSQQTVELLRILKKGL